MASSGEYLKENPLRVWFQDEGRFGLMGECRRCWAAPEVRPSAPQTMKREYIYGFAAICPTDGGLCALTMPYADGYTMSVFLDTLSKESSRFLNVVFLDGAGWHKSKDLKVPINIVLVPIPPYSPELNPVELLWDWIRDNYFKNDIIENLDTVEVRLLEAFGAAINQPEKLRSMASFTWIISMILSLNCIT